MKFAYSHLIDSIPAKPSLKEISDSLFQLGHEHEIVEENIFDIEFTPNRGDCLSIDGLLRDLALFYDVNINREIFESPIKNLSINFENNTKNSCSDISFLKIDVVNPKTKYTGIFNKYFNDLDNKKINFFTDVSNFISYESGQPTHCYDAKKIKDVISLNISNEDTSFHTLSDKKINLTGRNLVFSMNKEVINLAGIIGGKSTACSSETLSVIVECAHFNPEDIIGKSLKYNVISDASYKFERGVDPLCHERVLRRFLKIVDEHATITNVELKKHQFNEYNQIQIPSDLSFINKIIGIEIKEKDFTKYLSKLGFKFDGNMLYVPSHRSDIKTSNDIAEEISRAIGYDEIPITPINLPKKIDKKQKLIEEELKLKSFLIDNGFYEVINYPFSDDDAIDNIHVDNPLDSKKKYLRSSVKNSLIENLSYNERRQKDSVKLFELSDIYSINELSIQKKRILGIICSGRIGKNYIDFSKKVNPQFLENLLKKIMKGFTFDIKLIERSNQSKSKDQAVFVEINLSDLKDINIDYPKKSERLIDRKIRYEQICEYPQSSRDLSFAINKDSSYFELQTTILDFNNDLIKEVFIFDFYVDEKREEIKIGYRFIFQSKSSTITDEQVNMVMNQIIKNCLKIEFVKIPGLIS